jgi:hypothetical protein
MRYSIRQWRASHLLAVWTGYWSAIGAVLLAPALGAMVRVMTDPDGHATVSAGIGSGVATVVVKGGTASYSGSASVSTLLLWVAVPPLVLWLAWLLTRERPDPLSRVLDARAQRGLEQAAARVDFDRTSGDGARESRRHLRT